MAIAQYVIKYDYSGTQREFKKKILSLSVLYFFQLLLTPFIAFFILTIFMCISAQQQQQREWKEVYAPKIYFQRISLLCFVFFKNSLYFISAIHINRHPSKWYKLDSLFKFDGVFRRFNYHFLNVIIFWDLKIFLTENFISNFLIVLVKFICKFKLRKNNQNLKTN